MAEERAASYQLFLDLDGVLADFDRGVQDVTGKLPTEQSARAMWPRLAKTPRFYAELPWMPDGQQLWEYVRPHEPMILTGVPFGGWAAEQKREWCARELGAEVRVITCWSKEKAQTAHAELRSRGEETMIPVLVDDREKMRAPWESHGGLFILHTAAESSIQALARLGF